MNRERMLQQLTLHEGLRLQAYVDTEMNWTIGIGYNISGRGYDFLEKVVGHPVKPRDGMTEKAHITEAEAVAVCQADIDRVEKAVREYLPIYDTLDDVRQRVIVDLAFNMQTKALQFKKCIAAIKARNWSEASRQLWDSAWATEVGDGPGKKIDRADRLTNMLLTGRDYVA